jgi:hypothetical protein
MASQPRAQVPPETLARLRAICGALPEVREEAAWVGTRWRIRGKTFAHVLVIDGGRPQAYAEAAGSDGPLCVLTFRSSLAAFDPDMFRRPPFFRPRWFADIAGLAIDADTDWTEVAALVAGSYRLLAPKKLAALVGPS